MYVPIFRGPDARGGRKLRTDTHTNTRDNYSNPRCAHARRGLIKSQDKQCLVDEACKHQSVNLASSINWLRVWEAARDRGPYWSYIAQSFYRAITKPLFGDRSCVTCGSHIPESVSSFQHLTETHAPDTLNVPNLLADLLSSDSEPVSTSFHCMKSLVFLSKPTE